MLPRKTDVRALLRDTRGANLVEYIAVVAVIALVAIGSFRVFGVAVFARAEYEAACIKNLDGDCKGNGSSNTNPGSNESNGSSASAPGDVEPLDPPPPVAANAAGNGTNAAPPGPPGASKASGTGQGAGTSLGIARSIVRAGGSGTAADAEVVAQELAKLPANVLSTMKNEGIQVVAAKGSVTDYFSDLKGVRPRGWPPGSGWDSVPGLARGKTVVIAVRNGRVPPTGDGHGSANLVVHESFHAVDSAGGGRSNDPAFVAARQKDFGKLQPYLKQDGNAGREETFAESAAQYYGKAAGQSPNLQNYWSENADRIFSRKPK